MSDADEKPFCLVFLVSCILMFVSAGLNVTRWDHVMSRARDVALQCGSTVKKTHIETSGACGTITIYA